ncbi:MAG TPA: hypothetical protein VGB85_31050 [Nannocystis sp.]
MAYRASSTLALLLLAACGPGTDDVSATASTTDTSGDTTTGTTTNPTTGPTTGQTTGVTTEATTEATTGQTSDPTTGATGQTTDATTGDEVCPDQFPQDGTPCTSEGLSCSTGCEDPCEFCNVVQCENGTWQNLEVFPYDCLDCESVCEFVVPAACAGGPPDQAACVAGCMDNLAGDCKLVFNQMLGCIGSMPTFTCNAETRPTVAGCEDRFTELYACMGF